VLLDLGTYAVDQAIVLFGPVSAVYAELHVLAELDGFASAVRGQAPVPVNPLGRRGGAGGPRRRPHERNPGSGCRTQRLNAHTRHYSERIDKYQLGCSDLEGAGCSA
jgi:hypothetical protein